MQNSPPAPLYNSRGGGRVTYEHGPQSPPTWPISLLGMVRTPLPWPVPALGAEAPCLHFLHHSRVCLHKRDGVCHRRRHHFCSCYQGNQCPGVCVVLWRPATGKDNFQKHQEETRRPPVVRTWSSPHLAARDAALAVWQQRASTKQTESHICTHCHPARPELSPRKEAGCPL